MSSLYTYEGEGSYSESDETKQGIGPVVCKASEHLLREEWECHTHKVTFDTTAI